LSPERVIHARQNPAAIDAGAFHNDVIATGNEHVFLFHHLAFSDSAQVSKKLAQAYAGRGDRALYMREITRFSLDDAVRSYFFNSQLLTLPGGTMLLLAPEECRSIPPVAEAIAELVADPECPIIQAQFVDLRESMRNGGGPACLRNRVVLSEIEQASLSGRVLFDQELDTALTSWIKKRYRIALSWDDLRDPQLPGEIETALDELTHLLQLGPIYPFQQTGT
jgi:succinylarginine dihydrolase